MLGCSLNMVLSWQMAALSKWRSYGLWLLSFIGALLIFGCRVAPVMWCSRVVWLPGCSSDVVLS